MVFPFCGTGMQKQNKHNRHKNQVRIIGGELRGRKVRFVDAEGLRPTADSVRERYWIYLQVAVPWALRLPHGGQNGLYW